MINKHDNTELLLTRYKTLMEEAYNLRYSDPAMSDYDFYEGLKLRSFLELEYQLKFKKNTRELLQ